MCIRDSPCPDIKDKKSKVSEKKQARIKERSQLYGTLYVDLGNSINPDDDETRDKLLQEAQNARDKKSIGGWGSKRSRIDENHTEVSVVVSSNKNNINNNARHQPVDVQIDELEKLQKSSNEKDNQAMTEILLDDDLDNYLLTDEEQKKVSSTTTTTTTTNTTTITSLLLILLLLLTPYIENSHLGTILQELH